VSCEAGKSLSTYKRLSESPPLGSWNSLYGTFDIVHLQVNVASMRIIYVHVCMTEAAGAHQDRSACDIQADEHLHGPK